MNSKRIFKIIFTIAILTSTSYWVFETQQYPFLYLYFLWATGCISAIFLSTRSISKATWVNVSVVLMVLGGAETYYWIQLPAKHRTVVQAKPDQSRDGYHQIDDFLGYRPATSQSRRIKEHVDETLVFDVTYTTDEYGLRVHDADHDVEKCILFFGGSYTFGLGVEDHETLPSQVGQKSGYRTRNFGVGGYGPHQMLSALEHGIVESAVNCRPVLAIYQGLFDHIGRAAGERSWDEHGPLYELDANGVPHFAGNFDSNVSARSDFERVLKRSLVYTKVTTRLPWRIENNQQRFVAIIQASRNRLAELYPDAEFHVLIWSSRVTEVIDGIRSANIPIHDVFQFAPDIRKKKEKYQLSDKDAHPNALAYNEIADFVVDKLLASKTGAKHLDAVSK